MDSSVEFEEFPQPAPSQLALLQIYTDVLEGNDIPGTAAKRIHNWVLSVPESDNSYNTYSAYYEVLRVLFSGARALSSRKQLQILADLTVELTKLPNVYNNTDDPIEITQNNTPKSIEWGEGLLVVSGLPDFVAWIEDDLNGGPLQFRPQDTEVVGLGGQQQISRIAEGRYTNINTFAALIARQHPPQGSPLCSCVEFAFATFAFLEHGPNTNYDKEAHLTVRAAATWLIIAGEELVASGSPSTKYDYTSRTGSLWEAEGGTNAVDDKRLRFWKDRFQQIRESGRLVSQEAVDATIEAAAVLDRLIAAQG
ncbi:uncharacterized protein ALTATR162_LOCUS4334 [Alternaria atra]|uniref:Uncharacterized protein n=1 Tax=Alternaria atra TaxID=119953 RepID=A0A8J2I1G2_9PLEO|nr:uncharacterized protein ALTATR162_LOCUS4334 [Alternaria atra]CAG5156537.1 unnamed protein product [Alternaria atra]